MHRRYAKHRGIADPYCLHLGCLVTAPSARPSDGTPTVLLSMALWRSLSRLYTPSPSPYRHHGQIGWLSLSLSPSLSHIPSAVSLVDRQANYMCFPLVLIYMNPNKTLNRTCCSCPQRACEVQCGRCGIKKSWLAIAHISHCGHGCMNTTFVACFACVAIVMFVEATSIILTSDLEPTHTTHG